MHFWRSVSSHTGNHRRQVNFEQSVAGRAGRDVRNHRLDAAVDVTGKSSTLHGVQVQHFVVIMGRLRRWDELGIRAQQYIEFQRKHHLSGSPIRFPGEDSDVVDKRHEAVGNKRLRGFVLKVQADAAKKDAEHIAACRIENRKYRAGVLAHLLKIAFVHLDFVLRDVDGMLKW